MKKVRGHSAYIPIEEQTQAQLVSPAGPRLAGSIRIACSIARGPQRQDSRRAQWAPREALQPWRPGRLDPGSCSLAWLEHTAVDARKLPPRASATLAGR